MSIIFIFPIKQHLRTFFRHVYRIILFKNAFFVSVAISGRFDPKMTGLIVIFGKLEVPVFV